MLYSELGRRWRNVSGSYSVKAFHTHRSPGLTESQSEHPRSEVRLPALISPLGSPCGRALRRHPKEVRLWASRPGLVMPFPSRGLLRIALARRALRAAVMAWMAQADAGLSHDAYLDLAGSAPDTG